MQAEQAPTDSSQIGFEAAQGPLPMHSTQVFVVALHAGVAPLHWTRFVGLHWTHLPAFGPAVRHAGAVAVAHAFDVPELWSPSHAEHVPFAQTGVAPPQSAAVKHSPQVFVVRLQSGVVPPQLAFERH